MTIESTSHIVLVACPLTGEPVPTGYWADSLEELEPLNQLIDCPACGDDHDWSPAQAELGWGGGRSDALAPR